jgi:hypothetical protein
MLQAHVGSSTPLIFPVHERQITKLSLASFFPSSILVFVFQCFFPEFKACCNSNDSPIVEILITQHVLQITRISYSHFINLLINSESALHWPLAELL